MNYNNYIKNYRDLIIEHKPKIPELNSFLIRDNAITGNTYTVHDSANSQGVIASFKSMSTPKKNDAQSKRESILKMVLI